MLAHLIGLIVFLCLGAVALTVIQASLAPAFKILKVDQIKLKPLRSSSITMRFAKPLKHAN